MNLIERINAQLANDGFQFADAQRAAVATTFKEKVLAAANKQLDYLAKMHADSELDYASKGNSGKYWWAAKPTNDQRAVRYYVANRLLHPTSKVLHVPNNIAAVQRAIVAFRTQAEAMSEADWEAFSKQRKEDAAKKQ